MKSTNWIFFAVNPNPSLGVVDARMRTKSLSDMTRVRSKVKVALRFRVAPKSTEISNGCDIFSVGLSGFRN